MQITKSHLYRPCRLCGTEINFTFTEKLACGKSVWHWRDRAGRGHRCNDLTTAAERRNRVPYYEAQTCLELTS